MICPHILYFISQDTAEKIINEIIEGKTENINHPILYSDIDIKNIPLLLLIKRYMNEDLLSQCIYLSKRWQSIINTHISNIKFITMGGGFSNISIAESIFNKPAKDLTILQLRLLEITFKFLGYAGEYQVKSICKQCYENKTKPEEVFLKPRQKYCDKDKNHIVKHQYNRIIRYYYRQDKQGMDYILPEDYMILSILEFFTDKFSNMIQLDKQRKEVFNRINKKRKK